MKTNQEGRVRNHQGNRKKLKAVGFHERQVKKVHQGWRLPVSNTGARLGWMKAENRSLI